jgi:RNA polymerase sigma-70 factor (ECF subfamily)
MEGNDAATVARARAGDGEAFRALVERNSRSIFRLAYRMTGNEQDAEDVVQETFLRAYRRLNRFESRANFGTWLYRIAINCALDFMRQRGKHEERRAVGTSHGDVPNEIHSLPAEGPGQDHLVFGTELHRQVEVALTALSPNERAAFVLRHFEDMSIEQVGQALGLRASATKHSIFRAVRKLRRALDGVVVRI